MLAMPGMRSFAVSAAPSADGVSCNARGVFIGHAPLLERVDGRWMPGRAAELSDELTACYRLPVEIAVKANSLSLIAAALNRCDLAMAAIAAVQMQIPDPPRPAKGQEKPEDIVRRARELARSSLLKVWEPEEHPRAGTPPNPGWFVPVDGSEDQGVRVAIKPGPNNPWAEFPDAEGAVVADQLLVPEANNRIFHLKGSCRFNWLPMCLEARPQEFSGLPQARCRWKRHPRPCSRYATR